MLVDDTTERLFIPHEPNEWLEIRHLNYVQLEKVRAASEDGSIVKAKTLGAAFMADLEGVKSEKPTPKQSALASYDRKTLIDMSIVAWSYELPCNETTCEKFDEKTAGWLFEALVALYHPEAFDEGGEAQVKDCAASPTISTEPQTPELLPSGLSV